MTYESACWTLSRRQRNVWLCRQAGWPYWEIADWCGISPECARVHAHHARKRMRALGYEHEPAAQVS